MGWSRLRRVINAVGVVLALIAIVIAVLLAAPQVVGAEASYVVLSGSMAPTIQAGDIVVVGPADTDDIQAGDVITFRDADNPATGGQTDRVTHRVIEVRQTENGPRFVTKGDANEEPDPQPVRPSQVVGVVWFHIPMIGRLVLLAQSPYGLVAFVIIPGALLALSELYSLYSNAVVIEDTGRDASADGSTDLEGDEGHNGNEPEGAEAFEWGVTESETHSGGDR